MARRRSSHYLAAALIAAPLLLGATPTPQLEQAVAAQRALVAEQPDNAGALNDLGNLLVESGEMEEAEELYRQAMQTEPGRPEPPFNLALLLAANDHPREARRLLRAMLEEHPDHAWGHYQLGTLDQASGKRGRATLSDPSHNPHVLDNSLATAAMLEAFALIAPAVTSQRIYVEPRHITGLLLQPLSSPATEPMTETGEEPMMETGEEEPAVEEPAEKEPGT